MCNHANFRPMKAKKLKKGYSISVLGRMCRITQVHQNQNGDVTVHLRTYGVTTPDHFTAIVHKNARVTARPKKK